MKITCIIIDDESLARDLLMEYIQPYSDIEVVAQCSKGSEAVEKINLLEPDLIFLDVQMPGMDGFGVLEAIDHHPYVIFTTAYDQYALQAFDKNAVDYVLKPLNEERFKTAVQRAMDRITSEKSQNVEDLLRSIQNGDKGGNRYSSHLFVQKSEKLLNLEVKDIMYLEASGDYTVLSTKGDQFLSSSGIGKLEEKLDPEIFIRIHRSTIINLNYLKEIEKHFNGGLIVKMDNSKTFPVSRTYAKQIRKKVV
ncbi:LytR/AlgR family response regulator transcription factor [Fulvivirga sedimenti]|uniref:LytTR family DNA-binding domain-containing protein n=1 Tax=Fulvivirga sedimenti TaxID=2879465 RepID=A0A9X1HLT2_9BACT|nr:LytTR family DNA-binding domain-containing protein [Fulvivirga sedimenti]MCA6074241.1 LytTR family DNA-binding domain-containing protein [Fulvivirga sedimenti]